MTETPWWDAHRHADRRPLLLARNRIQRAIRRWLDAEGFTEADPTALAISPGTVYPLLARLAKGALVHTTWQESPVGPPRKYYALTDAGRTRLIDMAAAYRAVSHDLTDLLKDLPR